MIIENHKIADLDSEIKDLSFTRAKSLDQDSDLNQALNDFIQKLGLMLNRHVPYIEIHLKPKWLNRSYFEKARRRDRLYKIFKKMNMRAYKLLYNESQKNL